MSKTVFEDGKSELRNPDKTGNLFESLDRLDRKYAQGGQLLKTADWEYKYDREGNLVRKKDKHGATWRYEWNEAGMLAKVKRPDSAEVSFKYDALGRRIAKRFRNIITRWTWDGNVPLHEQKTQYWRDYEKERGEFLREDKQPLVTWVFEEGTFVPVARITDKQQLSIVTNYLGTPEAMYREDGEAVWTCELNSYGKVRNFQGEFKTDCPFRYQGQYEDSETGLFYNRFRYYSPEEGVYISQDPIRLAGNNPTLYGYVWDTNDLIDPLGLKNWNYNNMPKIDGYQNHHVIPRSMGDHPAIKAAGVDLDNSRNLIYLPTDRANHSARSVHKGWNKEHSAYNNMMRDKLDKLYQKGMKKGWGQQKFHDEVSKLSKDTRQNLRKGKIKCH